MLTATHAPAELDQCARSHAGPEESATAIRIVISSPQPLLLDGLESVLSAEPDVAAIRRCDDIEHLDDAIGRLEAHVALLDVDLDRAATWKLVRHLSETAPATKLLLLTTRVVADKLIDAVRLGVRGVLLKSIPSPMIVECVRHVQRGGYWLDKQMTAAGLRSMMRPEAARRDLARAGLTPRELQIATLAGQGVPLVSIGTSLKISPATVKVHLHQVYRKLGLSNRTALVIYAREHALA
jgi:two-component system nitrate/nitrite response regulator NarL